MNVLCAWCGKDSGIPAAWDSLKSKAGNLPCGECGKLLEVHVDEDSDCNYWFISEQVEGASP
jgi:transcription elongation factor Elf1